MPASTPRRSATSGEQGRRAGPSLVVAPIDSYRGVFRLLKLKTMAAPLPSSQALSFLGLPAYMLVIEPGPVALEGRVLVIGVADRLIHLVWRVLAHELQKPAALPPISRGNILKPSTTTHASSE